MEKIQALYIKYKEVFWYLVFGVLTTLINIVVFGVLEYFDCFASFNKAVGIKDFNLIIINVCAWILSVIFAYVTNKKWVFESEKNGFLENLKEMGAFFSCRIATGVMDVIIVYVFVSVFHGPAIIVKIASNVLVIILNYVWSKLIVFKKKKEIDNKDM